MAPDTSVRFRRAVSGQMLFYIALAVSLALTAAFSVSVLAASKRADRQMHQTVEAQMLRILENSGVSGLAAAFDTSRTIVLPGAERLEIALWQVRGDTRRLLLETSEGAAEAFGQPDPHISLNGKTYGLRRVDVAAAAKDWALPMQDVELVFGFQAPTREMRRAYRMIAIIVAVSLSVCLLMSFLQGLYWQRYRTSISRINALLDRYSNGETGIRFTDETPTAELRELGRHLNVVLPRIDGLFADLRALSAHLAHELRTPLQTIRSGVRKIVREDDKALRAGLARKIDQSIDGADARLQTIMQLFRLQADAGVAMTPGVALGQILEDLVYDFEDGLTRHDRTLRMDIDKSVTVTGNVHLIELMISNLLSNTAKYAQPRSEITVTLKGGQGFTLAVTNAGTLSDDLSAHAFDRYAQGTEHRSLTGSGLGLALVYAIAQKHGFSTGLSPETGPDGAAYVRAVVTGPAERAHDA